MLLSSCTYGSQLKTDANQTQETPQWVIFTDGKETAPGLIPGESVIGEQSRFSASRIALDLQNNSNASRVLTLVASNDTANYIELEANVSADRKLEYEIQDPPSHGNISKAGPALIYTPEKGYVGNDSFNISVGDDQGGRQVITAAIQIVQLYHPPSARILNPQNGDIITADEQTYTATIPIRVASSGDVDQIDVYADTILIGSFYCPSECPVAFDWETWIGQHTLIAKATDTNGLTCTSLPVTFTVNPPQPLVKIVSPLNGQIFTAPAEIDVMAEVVDDNPIEYVEFFANSQKIGEATDAPYELEWEDVTPGVYYLLAKATDDQGNSAISKTILVIVVPIDPLAKSNLALSMSTSPNPARIGGIVNYVLTLTNKGPSGATGVMVTDLLPEELTFRSAKASLGTFDETTGEWDVGNLAKYHSARLSISMRVPGDLKLTQLKNYAEATCEQPDPDNSNNQASVTTKLKK